jgi:hypothetical protein
MWNWRLEAGRDVVTCIELDASHEGVTCTIEGSRPETVTYVNMKFGLEVVTCIELEAK